MPITKNELEKMLAESLPDAKIFIEDLKGDGDHYSATIISKIFEGKNIPLKKGYLGVVNRSQADINNKKTIQEAVDNENEWFKGSPYA